MRLLVNITAYRESEKSYVEWIVANYLKEYADIDTTIVLTAPFSVAGTISLPIKYKGEAFNWSGKDYIRDNINQFHYVIDQEADILIPRKSFDVYRQHQSLPIEYIPGILYAEKDPDDVIKILSMNWLQMPVKEKLTLNGIPYFIPRNNHSGCLIADSERYQYAMFKGMTDNPQTNGKQDVLSLSKTLIYDYFKKVIPQRQILDCLVWHLPNKFTHRSKNEGPPTRYMTWEQAVKVTSE